MTNTNDDYGGEWDGNFTVVPPGYYKAVVKTAEARESQNGNKMVTMVLEIEHDEYGGVTIYDNLMFMPDANSFANKKRQWFQESAGIPYSLNDDNNMIAKQIVNRKVTIKVKTTNRDGKDRNDIFGVHSYSWTPEGNQNEKLKLDDGDGNLDDSFI